MEDNKKPKSRGWLLPLLIGLIPAMLTLFAIDILISSNRYVGEDNNVHPIDKLTASTIAWQENDAISPNGKWRAYFNNKETTYDSAMYVLIVDSQSWKEIANLTAGDSDLAFHRIAWLDDNTLAVEQRWS